MYSYQGLNPKPCWLGMQEHKFFEESFKVYERGVSLFKWPHVKDLWQAYLAQFVQRYKGTKLERARDLFRQAIDSVRIALLVFLLMIEAD